MKKILALLLFTPLLSGCIAVAGAAAGAGAVTMAYEHRKIENVAQDQHISNLAYERIHSTPELRENAHIEVACFNGVVLLTGEATSPELRQQAEAIVKAIPNVDKIYNQITIQGPISSLTRTSDSWITAKIKTEMLATKGLKSGTVKVVTENGAVYLMGVVDQDQADAAVEIARQVAGVQRVVKIFQYKKQ